MFFGFDVGSDIASRHQSGVMTELRQLTRPEMRSAASFEADKARRNIGEETQPLLRASFLRRTVLPSASTLCTWNQVFDVSSPIVVIVIAPLPVSSGVLPLGCGDRPSHYFRFPLSLRMVEEMLAARGICVTYETVRQWGKKFGKAFSDQIRQRAPARGDKWHMDEVVVSISGEQHWLGAPSIKMASFSTSWSSVEETVALRSNS